LQDKPKDCDKLGRCGENVAFVEGNGFSKGAFGAVSGRRSCFWTRELFLDEGAVSGRGSCFWTREPYIEYSYVWPFSSSDCRLTISTKEHFPLLEINFFTK
jgi:hypothetical protein